MRNVMVDGADGPLGNRLAEFLARRPEVKRLVGVEPDSSSDWSPDIEMTACEPDHRRQLEFMQEYEIDTVIQCGVAPDRSGAPQQAEMADVIGTMRLGAAIGHAESPVRCWVVLSSSSVYPVNSNRPLLNREGSKAPTDVDVLSTSLLEAEKYAGDVARRAPHLNVAILRLQELIGLDVRGALSAHFDQTLVPSVIGHDPVIQFLHIEDAVAAISFAANLELAGIYNVASRGEIRFSDFLANTKRQGFWLPPIGAGALAPFAAMLGLPHIPDGLLDRLRFGHAIDTGKIEAAGFNASADQLDCAAVLQR